MASIEGNEALDWRITRPALVRFLARRTGCDAAAEDLAQDLWLKLQAGGAWREAEIRNPLAYLFRAAANAAFDWRRREAGAAAAPAEFEQAIADEAPSPERQAQGREAASLIEAAIAQLPPKCRAAFLLCRVEGLTMREAGRRMGVSERTVENHLAKATVLCRRALIDAGAWP
ncbi:MAG: RNA polymerase sigma factor [Candidatus Andeanibacterium colombiense]|uniref:RNA polymerase sigma factor n=1 Tax=Candidatus Andeanibacterium colombiense TaxID=3121345 RepID=A0AAJ5X383_9SPHN|nr:MAG: RNA polymerase sigma factor [Sphingomonadaceae bacterium]